MFTADGAVTPERTEEEVNQVGIGDDEEVAGQPVVV